MLTPAGIGCFTDMLSANNYHGCKIMALLTADMMAMVILTWLWLSALNMMTVVVYVVLLTLWVSEYCCFC